MATPLEKLIKEKLDRLETVPDGFASSIDSHQKKIFSELVSLLDDLDRENGTIVISEKNIARIEKIISSLEDVFFDKDYAKALKAFASEFDTQAKITDRMFKAGFDEVPNKKIFDAILRASKKNALTLFGENAIGQEYFSPLRAELTRAITSGANFKDTIKSLQSITIGNETADGLLQAHAKTYARTSFSVADRAYTTSVAQNYKVEFYKYSGSVIETSRPFCETRHDRYYHVKEVESWGDLKPWSGWMKGTNSSTIFQNLGGWNCRHSLIPYSVFAVPLKDVQRAIDEGWYKPDKATREKLGV